MNVDQSGLWQMNDPASSVLPEPFHFATHGLAF
jgi:hypothetical protein